MATALRPIGHEDRLSLIDHLEELRARLIVSIVVLTVAFGVCFWQNHALLHLIDRPLDTQIHQQIEAGKGPLGQTRLAQRAVLAVAADTELIVKQLSARGSGLTAATRAALVAEIPHLRAAVGKLPRHPTDNNLVTLGVGEPFTTTLTVVFCFALICSLPVILYELYGFILPALHPSERRAARPLIVAIPFLFVAGVAFGYYVVLPAALHFLQNFNSEEFSVLVQANQYYQFAATVLLAMGLVFQVPVAILAATRAGIVTPAQLRRGRRYALVVCAAIAAFLPGDAITLILETLPLYVLYEASILIASFVARRDTVRDRRRAAAEPPPGSPPSSGGGTGQPDAPPGGPDRPARGGTDDDTERDVRAIIDHIDNELSN